MCAAESVSQLGGVPDFDLATIAGRPHITYETFADEDLKGAVEEMTALGTLQCGRGAGGDRPRPRGGAQRLVGVDLPDNPD